MKKTIYIKDLTEQEINYHIARLILKYPEKGYTVFISSVTGKCVARKTTGPSPCCYKEVNCDFAGLWDPLFHVFQGIAPQVLPTNPVETLRYVLTLAYGESLELD